MVIDELTLCCFSCKDITALYLIFPGRFILGVPIITMEMSIKTMMIMVIGMIALILIITLFAYNQGQTTGLLDGLFDWFKGLGV